jgi:hypothetical protein
LIAEASIEESAMRIKAGSTDLIWLARMRKENKVPMAANYQIPTGRFQPEREVADNKH